MSADAPIDPALIGRPIAEDGAGRDVDALFARSAEQVRAAGERVRKIRRAAAVAGLNGWAAAVFAVCALAGGFWSLPALVLGVGLAYAAFLELRGRALLLRLNPRGPALLAANQGLIVGAVTVYCLWQIWNITHSPAPELEIAGMSDLAAMDPAMGDMIASAASMANTVMLGVYGLVIVLTVLFQGLMAMYYLSRGRLLAEHVRLTPPWIADIQRRLAA